MDTAADGFAALKKVSDFYYNVVVSDISMPEMDGIQLLGALVNIEHFNREAFILMSGNVGTSSSLMRDLEVRIIEKPFSLDALVSMVEQAIRR